MPLALRYAARSDVGMVRKGNEDSGYAAPRLLVVADGMGGHAAGELASATTVATMADLASQTLTVEEAKTLLTNAVHGAGISIGQVVSDNPDFAGMGTTVTAAYWLGENIVIAQVGDSRAYLLRYGLLSQLTHDQTYVQTLVDAGRITEEEAAVHPRRSLLMRAIDGMQPVEPELTVIEAQVGDRLLLCSDGLSGVVSAQEIQQVLSQGEPTGTVTALVDLALSRGAPDNVTVVVADVLSRDDDHLADLGGEPVVVGAAGEPRVRAQLPRVHFPKDAQVDPNRPDLPPPTDGGPPTSELPPIDAAAPLPAAASRGMSERTKHSLKVGIIAAVIALVLVAIAAFASLAWVRAQWYVGVSDGRVTIYNGVPGSPLGIPLQTATEVTDLQVSTLPVFDADQVTRGFVADGEAGAQRIVATLREKAAACAVIKPPSGCPTPAPAPSPSPSPNPLSSSAAP